MSARVVIVGMFAATLVPPAVAAAAALTRRPAD
jgi:hypothetical protein